MKGPAPPAPWKAVALPVEHGGWGLLIEPVLLGLVLAPSSAGFCLAGAAVAAFLARHPLRLVFMDRRKGARYPRTALAELFAVGYATLALAFVTLATLLASASFWTAIAVGVPPALVALAYDLRGRSREAFPEAAGGVALGASAAAIALAGGVPAGVAFGAWALLALRDVTAVLYVRARLRLDRGVPAGTRGALASHAAAIAVAAALAGRTRFRRPASSSGLGAVLPSRAGPPQSGRFPGVVLRVPHPRTSRGRLSPEHLSRRAASSAMIEE